MASSGKAKGKEKDKAQQQVQPQVPTSVEPAEREVVLGRLKESEWYEPLANAGFTALCAHTMSYNGYLELMPLYVM